MYFCLGEKNVVYALHGNSIVQLLGRIAFIWSTREIKQPWRIYINHNADHKNLELRSDHFERNASTPFSAALKNWLASVVSGYIYEPDSDLAFVEAKSGRRIPIAVSAQERMAQLEAERKALFASVSGRPAKKEEDAKGIGNFDQFIRSIFDK